MPDLFGGIYKNKRVLVTGHTGFKGSWLSIWLNDLGAEVIGYALDPRTRPNLYESCGLEKEMVSVIADIRDPGTLKRAFKKYKPEIVFHMAAQPLVRHSYKKPHETYETNVMGTVNLLEACRESDSARAIVIVTSDKCYKNEELKKMFREDDPMGGDDPYSSSKGCAELVTLAYSKSFFDNDGLKKKSRFLASVRAGNVIGGGDWSEDRLIPDCIRAFTRNRQVVIRHPDAVRPWQHVLEPLYGYLLLAKNLYQKRPGFSGAWNFGSDDRDSKPVRWIVEKVAEMWGCNSGWTVDKDKNPREAENLKLDCSKARSRLKWSLRWDMETALSKTIECYRAYYDKRDVKVIIKKQIHDYEECILKRGDRDEMPIL